MITKPAKKSEYRIDTITQIVGGDAERRKAIAQYQYKTLWTYAANCILGFWLVSSPFLLNYGSPALAGSDMICGALIVTLELLSFSPSRYWLRWLTPCVAVWLLFAPLIFWSPTPAVYLLDTLIASLVITFSILVPSTPGLGGVEKPGPDMPPGWSYNPSSWIRRWLGIALALFGFLIARYLAARQLGYIAHAWDPFFGNGSERVLHSVVSKSFPISDAGFGAVAYILELLAGFMGDRARWRTAPWIVTTFAMLVVPLGVTSIILVILQPVVVGAWCGLCIVAAVALLASVPLAVHEIIAMGQFMLAAVSQGKNFWEVFWYGGSITGAGAEDPDRSRFSFSQRFVASIQGVTVPWAIVLQLAIGVWLMARPDIVHFNVATANCDHLLGAVIVTIAGVATAEVTRTVRLLNIPVGLLLVAIAVVFGRDLPAVFWSELISGVVVALAALPRGEIVERYDGWNRFVK